jgi:hypothetical protein
MDAGKIIAIAEELDCGPRESAVTFARMVAEHCAQLADEAEHSGIGAAAIRKAFLLGDGVAHLPSSQGSS